MVKKTLVKKPRQGGYAEATLKPLSSTGGGRWAELQSLPLSPVVNQRAFTTDCLLLTLHSFSFAERSTMATDKVPNIEFLSSTMERIPPADTRERERDTRLLSAHFAKSRPTCRATYRWRTPPPLILSYLKLLLNYSTLILILVSINLTMRRLV